MKKALSILVLCGGLLCLAFPSWGDYGTTYYVSTTGNDSNAGTMGAPFATVEGARDAIRVLKAGPGLPTGGVEVLIRGGTYPVTNAIILTSEDKGNASSPIAYKAYPDEQVIFDGSKTINSSLVQPVSNTNLLNSVIDATARANLKQIDLTAAGILPSDIGVISRGGFGGVGSPYGQIDPAQFYIDQERQRLASWPNDLLDGVTIKSVVSQGPTFYGGDPNWIYDGGVFEYDYSAGNRPALWTYTGSNPDDLWIQGVFNRDWQNSRNQVESINTGTKRVTLAYGELEGIQAGSDGKFHQYVNVPEEIDLPGEYWIDRSSNMLYFYEPASYSDLRMSVLDENMLMLDQCRYVTFEDIYFRYGRADGVILLTCSDVVIENCEIAHFAGQSGAIRTGDDALDTFKQDWTAVHGNPTEATFRKQSGSRSYIPNEDRDQIRHALAGPTGTDLTVYFYDYAPEPGADVSADALDTASGNRARIGIHTGTSASKYAYDIGNGTWVASGINRSTGWHKLEIDLVNDRLRIDNTTIATGLAITQFDEIYLGDETADGRAGLMTGFDTVTVDGGSLLDNGFETNTRNTSSFYRNGFRSCRVYDIGGKGFTMNGGPSIDDPGNNFIENCEISDFAHLAFGWNGAVSVLQNGNRVTGNTIYDAPHVAITAGGNDTVIEYNEIYDVCYLMEDMGAIYQAGNGGFDTGGLHIYRNYFHDIGQDADVVNAVFMDNQKYDATIEQNIFRNIGKGANQKTDAVKLNGAGYIVVTNNLFLDCRRPIWHTKNNLENTDHRNTFLNSMNSRYGGSFAGTPYLKYPHLDDGVGTNCLFFVELAARDSLIQPGDNIYYLPPGNVGIGNVIYNPNLSLQGGAETGHATNFDTPEAMSYTNNWVAGSTNPGFVDYDGGDLNLQSNATVFTQLPGFPDIPFSAIGINAAVGPHGMLAPPAGTVVDLNFDTSGVVLPARSLTVSNATEMTYAWSDSNALFNGDVAQGQKIYGGLRVTGGADVSINRFELNNDASPGRLQLAVPDGAANGYEQSRMLMLWDDADFSFSGNIFDATTNSSFSLTLTQALQQNGSERGFRFVVRDGDTYYVANQLLGNSSIGSVTTLTMAGNLAGLEWGAFDPNDFESVNIVNADVGMGVTFSPMIFDEVTGVGFLGNLYRWQGSYMQATDFQVNLVEGPSVDNGTGATNITDNSATLTGSLTAGTVADLHFYWGTVDGGSTMANWQHTNMLSGVSEGTHSVEIAGLLEETVYYYRCYAVNSAGEVWASATTNFTTTALIGPRVVVDLNFDDDADVAPARVADIYQDDPGDYLYDWSSGSLLFNGSASLGQKIYGGYHGWVRTGSGSRPTSLNFFDLVNGSTDRLRLLLKDDGPGDPSNNGGYERSNLLLLWDSADFLVSGHVFDGTTNSWFSLDVTQNLTGKGYRFVIRDGNTYYVANKIFGDSNSAFTADMDGTTAGLEWGAFDPNDFDLGTLNLGAVNLGQGVTFSSMTFSNVTGVGLYAQLDRWQGSYMQVADFQVALQKGPANDGYTAWATDNGVGPMGEDDDEDGLNNLGEYAYKGDPKDPNDQGLMIFGTSGSQFFLAHAMLIDTHDVEYIVEVNDSGDLVSGGWTNAGITVTSGILDADYNMVTNSVTLEDQGFIRYSVIEK